MKDLIVLLAFIFFQATAIQLGTSSGLPMSLPGCPDKCGNVSIPYPFGIGAACAATSLNPNFTVTCNTTFQPPRPMIGYPSPTMEVLDISLKHAEMRVYGPVNYHCFMSNNTMSDNSTEGFHLEGTPFILSSTRNRFTVIGCNTLGMIGGYMHSNPDLYLAGCYSYCLGVNNTFDGAPCTGKGCCETTISPNLNDFTPLIVMNQSSVWNFNPCFYAMLVEAGWYSFRRQDLVGHLGFIKERASRGVPMLVYEFVSNGTLFDFLHETDKRSPIPMDLRLKIATQSAEALGYIHSSTSQTILHGDVKSLNILLDDCFRALPCEQPISP